MQFKDEAIGEFYGSKTSLMRLNMFSGAKGLKGTALAWSCSPPKSTLPGSLPYKGLLSAFSEVRSCPIFVVGIVVSGRVVKFQQAGLLTCADLSLTLY